MINGDLYQRSNRMQRVDAKHLLDTFSPQFKRRPDGQDSLLDIGCGSADVTVDYIVPVLPAQYSRIVGADISEGMLSHARKMVHQPKMHFKILNVEHPLNLGVWTESFDHITSFHCLHWVQNQRQAMRNVFDLLTPGGDCLLGYMCSHPYYDVYARLAQSPRWAPHLQDAARFISPLHYSSEPQAEMERMLHEVGFSECTVQVQDRTFVFQGPDEVRGMCETFAFTYYF